MRTSSCKAKGRRLSTELVALLYRYAPELEPGDIVATSSGVTGVDVQLSPAALKLYPAAFECKNQEALNIWSALAQAESNAIAGKTMPVLVFRRNKSKTYAVVEVDILIRLMRMLHVQDPMPEAR